MAFTIAHMPTLRDVVGHSDVITARCRSRTTRRLSSRAPRRHRADTLAGRLHFLPHSSRGSWPRFAAVRTEARLRGLARLATNRWIIDTEAYPHDRLTKLRMLGIGVGRLAGCSRDD